MTPAELDALPGIGSDLAAKVAEVAAGAISWGEPVLTSAITADSLENMWWGAGYAVAQDRLQEGHALVPVVAEELGEWLGQNRDALIGINVPPEILGRGGIEYVAEEVTDA